MTASIAPLPRFAGSAIPSARIPIVAMKQAHPQSRLHRHPRFRILRRMMLKIESQGLPPFMSWILMVALIGMLGCDGGESNHRTSKKEKQNDDKINSGSVVIKSRNDLNAFLVKGLPISDLVKSLGSPDSVMLHNGTGPGPDSGDDWFIWTYYDYPNEAIGADLTITVRSRVGGFSVGDTVWDWHFTEP